ncbi:MAG TPA: hypothetical protein VGM10_03455 [Actinocrinis sp.]
MEQVLAALEPLSEEQLRLLARVNLARALRIALDPGDWGVWSVIHSVDYISGPAAGLGDLAAREPGTESLVRFTEAVVALDDEYDQAPVGAPFWPFTAASDAYVAAYSLQVATAETCRDYAESQVEYFFEFTEFADNHRIESERDIEDPPSDLSAADSDETFTARELRFWLDMVQALETRGAEALPDLIAAGRALAEQYITALQALS